MQNRLRGIHIYGMDIKRKISLLLPLVPLVLLLLASCEERSLPCCGPDVLYEKTAYEHFVDISGVPRCSGDEKAVSDYLMEFARVRGLVAYRDGMFNVLIRKNGSPGREGEPPVALQAHIDMTCAKDSGEVHDFGRDPIVPVITDGDWVRAEKRTSLGADNGSGVSMIMAVLASGRVSHPPVEALFVVQEELGLLGSLYFDISQLSARRLINLDSVDEGELVAASSGRFTSEMVIPVSADGLPDGLASYKVTARGPWDAIIMIGRVLDALDGMGIYLSGVDGSPRECAAVISLDVGDADTVRSIVSRVEADYRPLIPGGMEMSITIEEAAAAQSVMGGGSPRRIADGILQMPNGRITVIRQGDGVFETVINFVSIVTASGTVTVSNSARSNVLDGLPRLSADINALAALIGGSAEIEQGYPGWPFAPVSPLRDRMAEVFAEYYGSLPPVRPTSGGLDCAAFAQKDPGLDMVSIGPDIENLHSPDERMSLPSFNRVYEYLLMVLGKI